MSARDWPENGSVLEVTVILASHDRIENGVVIVITLSHDWTENGSVTVELSQT